MRVYRDATVTFESVNITDKGRSMDFYYDDNDNCILTVRKDDAENISLRVFEEYGCLRVIPLLDNNPRHLAEALMFVDEVRETILEEIRSL